MSKETFEGYRKLWKLEWYNHWRLLDIDFEAYMLMRGLPKGEFDRLNKEEYGEEIPEKQ
jgi:lysyl-tRNA synthetase class I